MSPLVRTLLLPVLSWSTRNLRIYWTFIPAYTRSNLNLQKKYIASTFPRMTKSFARDRTKHTLGPFISRFPTPLRQLVSVLKPVYLLTFSFIQRSSCNAQTTSSSFGFQVSQRSHRLWRTKSLGTCWWLHPRSGSMYQLFESTDDHERRNGKENIRLRDKLRQATGFSLTTFRSGWRAFSGVSLRALYGGTAISAGLWIRTISALVLGMFPAWFRYFIQPILVLYYAPIFILRGLSGPARKNAIAKHKLIVDGWKKAIDFVQQAENDGYQPVKWNDEGSYFEMTKPPKPTKLSDDEQLADAVAESIDHAMENKYRNDEGAEV
eukprot:scaffold350_cov133-Cylindrotheca_fusiformis.AAC.19